MCDGLRDCRSYSCSSSFGLFDLACMIMLELFMFETFWEEPVFASNPRCLRLAPITLGRLSTARCIEGSRRSTVINLAILVETSGCCRRGSKLIIQQAGLLSARGVTRSERVGSGVWAGTPGPVDYPPGDGGPTTTRSPCQLSKRNRIRPRAEEEPLSRFLNDVVI